MARWVTAVQACYVSVRFAGESPVMAVMEGGDKLAKFDKGVPNYTVATAEVRVNFPGDDVICRWCPFLKHYDSIDRDRCLLTNDILYSREIVGYNCPLVIINNVTEGDLKS